MAITIYGKFTAKPGQRKALSKILLDAAELLEDLDGCLFYLVSEAENDEDTIWVHELWKDAEAHANSLRDERVLACIQRAKPLITHVEPIKLRLIGGKGA